MSYNKAEEIANKSEILEQKNLILWRFQKEFGAVKVF
jgi:hypothetical protein